MDLDAQLSALVAGDLDPEEARAVRARVEADPALRRRLARHERLQSLLTGWEVPEMTADQRNALDTAVTDALAALEDGPLVDDGARVVGLRPPTADDRDDAGAAARRGGAASAGGSDVDLSGGPVTDLAAERARRRGLPSWVSGLVAAAAGIAVVGTIGVGLAGLGSRDDVEVADEAMIAADTADAQADDGAADAADAAMPEEEMADDAAAAAAGGADDAGMDEDAAETSLAMVVEPIVVEDLGLLDAETVGTVPAQVPPALLEEAIGLLTERAVAPDVLAEERARTDDLVRSRLPSGECLDRSLAELAGEDLLVLVGGATFDGAPAVATVTLRVGGSEGTTTPSLVTTVRDDSTCTVVAELVSEP